MAVRFDAASDRLSWAGTAPTPSSGLTVAYWAYIVVDRNDFSTMIRLHAGSGGTTCTNLATDSGGQLVCNFTAGGSSAGPQNLPVGSWARVAVTVTGTTSTIYVALDAAGATQSQAGTVGANGAVSPDSGYTVGGRAPADASEWYNGRLAHLRLWSAVLTQTEIETEWASATPVRTANLFADYPLADATDLTDHSGAGRHLSAGSTAVTTEDGPPITSTVTGTLAATLPTLAASGAGEATTAGQLTVTLPTVAASGAGTLTAGGQLGGELPALTSTTTGGLILDGQLVATLPAIQTVAAGAAETAGQLVAALPALDTELAGTSTVAGDAAAILPALTAALSGSVATPITGTVAVTLPALTMASGRVAWPPAVVDTPLAALVGVDGPSDVPWIAVS